MDPYEKRVELPSVQEVFYGPREPTYFVDTDAYHQRSYMPHMMQPPVYHARDIDPVYRTRALVAPSSTATHVVPVEGPVKNVKTHPKGLVLSVPMCCDKCVEKVRKALEDLDGVRDIDLDQYSQLVTIHGDVDPEKALRRVRRVKKRSEFWKRAIQPLQYSGSPATGQVYSKSLVNAYRAPSSTYTEYLSSPRYTSSYLRARSSPYIDSAYRSGYVEPRGLYIPYGKFAHDDLEYRSRYDRGTPFVQMNDV